MDNSGQINNEKAFSFLNVMRQHKGYINLVAIHPEKKFINGITRPTGHEDIAAFIEEHNGHANLYFMVNEPQPDAPDAKLTKEHIAKIHAVWIDADPDKTKNFESERIRLLKFADDLKRDKNAPTYIIDSGGGIQAFWFLKTPTEANDDTIEHYESLSRGLEHLYDTDAVHNVDRIMRVPFTMNIPTPTKRALGRSEAASRVYYAASAEGVRYD